MTDTETQRAGFAAIIGAPNAGKSSLLNALARRDAAIVTASPGTTRDVIEVPLVLAGYKVLLADTAGVRETEEVIEAEGVRRARAWAAEADLRLWVVDGSAGDGAWREAAGLIGEGDLILLNKTDQPEGSDAGAVRALGRECLSLSLKSGMGLEGLEQALATRVVAALGGSETPLATRLRHGESLREARARLVAALDELEPAVELAAENVRLAARALARVTGRIGAEDILDVVFSSFCIGK